MQSHVKAVRAITSEYARQFIRPFVQWGIIIASVLLLIIAFLMYQFSPWWGLAAMPVIIATSAGCVAWLIVRMITARLSPSLTPHQKLATKQFVAKAQGLTENLQTPYFLIGLKIIKDVVLRRKSGFIMTLVQDSRDLRPDFEKLRRLFEEGEKG